MTMIHVRAFAWLVADWCVDENDLSGFSIDIQDSMLTVNLRWESDGRFYSQSARFTVAEIDRIRDHAAMLGHLKEIADRCRADIQAWRESERRKAPARLPG